MPEKHPFFPISKKRMKISGIGKELAGNINDIY
jgi:hypothetical protein